MIVQLNISSRMISPHIVFACDNKGVKEMKEKETIFETIKTICYIRVFQWFDYKQK